MHVEFLANGGVSLLLSPENEMEEALLKQMCKQENDITEVRSTITVFNKTFRNGIFIGRKSMKKPDEVSPESLSSDDTK
jgi:hypothetical protein